MLASKLAMQNGIENASLLFVPKFSLFAIQSEVIYPLPEAPPRVVSTQRLVVLCKVPPHNCELVKVSTEVSVPIISVFAALFAKGTLEVVDRSQRSLVQVDRSFGHAIV
tara:strand:+ start:296 stop:622 length:327 start_codon:yes stop_codon:yes gene_type:complete